jgi:hypothetical protein
MGHIRLGFLPQTQQWKKIINLLASYGSTSDDDIVKKIAYNTLVAIKTQYQKLPYNESIIKAISYLSILCLSAKQNDQLTYLNSHGFNLDKLSVYSLITNAQKLITTNNDSLEINQIAKDAMMQSLLSYQKNYQNIKVTLFEDVSNNPFNHIGDGKAFCELARYFFAHFTDRQIKYFIEREAAGSIANYVNLNKFLSSLSSLSFKIADHAFEISKIMQSFAAGWFNKYSSTDLPDDDKVTSFLRIAFHKIHEEFQLEIDENEQ